MSNVTLEELGAAKFKEAIDDALDAAAVLVVVASSLEYVKSPWVSYEWNSFFNDMLSKVKPNAQVFTYTEGVSPNALRGEESMTRLGRFLTNLLSRN